MREMGWVEEGGPGCNGAGNGWIGPGKGTGSAVEIGCPSLTLSWTQSCGIGLARRVQALWTEETSATAGRDRGERGRQGEFAGELGGDGAWWQQMCTLVSCPLEPSLPVFSPWIYASKVVQGVPTWVIRQSPGESAQNIVTPHLQGARLPPSHPGSPSLVWLLL